MVYVERRDQCRFRRQTLQSSNRGVDRKPDSLERQQSDSGIRVRVRIPREGHSLVRRHRR